MGNGSTACSHIIQLCYRGGLMSKQGSLRTSKSQLRPLRSDNVRSRGDGSTACSQIIQLCYRGGLMSKQGSLRTSKSQLRPMRSDNPNLTLNFFCTLTPWASGPDFGPFHCSCLALQRHKASTFRLHFFNLIFFFFLNFQKKFKKLKN